MSRTGSLLDAVAAELNAVVWGEDVTISKTYLPEVERTELATLHVAVVVQSMTLEAIARGIKRWVYRIDVGLQKRVDLADVAEARPARRVAGGHRRAFHRDAAFRDAGGSMHGMRERAALFA